MAGDGNLLLQWDYTEEPYTTIRSFRILMGTDCLYKFHTVVHEGINEADTIFYRFNNATARFENAGQIRWVRHQRECKVSFGVFEFSSRELRRPKKQSSKSRRFRVNNTEYKWKKSDDGKQLTCMDLRHNPVADWNYDTSKMTVTSRGETILDHVVVTCLLHQWWILHERW